MFIVVFKPAFKEYYYGQPRFSLIIICFVDQLYQSLTLKYLNAVASFRIRRIVWLNSTNLSPGEERGGRHHVN